MWRSVLPRARPLNSQVPMREAMRAQRTNHVSPLVRTHWRRRSNSKQVRLEGSITPSPRGRTRGPRGSWVLVFFAGARYRGDMTFQRFRDSNLYVLKREFELIGAQPLRTARTEPGATRARDVRAGHSAP